jgi:hypothetical protein
MVIMTIKEKLLLAIEQAAGPGDCIYVYGNQPVCVIGQLGAIEGVSIKRMEEWGNYDDGSAIGDLYYDVPEFQKYPRVLLKELQEIWDMADDWIYAKREMVDLVTKDYADLVND